MNQSDEPDLDPSEDGKQQSQTPSSGGGAGVSNEQDSPIILTARGSAVDDATQYPGEAAIRNDRALLASGQVEDSKLSLLSIASS